MATRKLPSDLATVWLRATAAFLGRTWSRPRVRSVKSLNGNIMFCSCLFYSKFIQHIEFLVSDFQHVCNFHMTSWKTIPFSTAMQKRHLSLARRQIHIAQVLCQDQTKFTTQVLNHSEHHRFRYVIPMTSWASAWKKKTDSIRSSHGHRMKNQLICKSEMLDLPNQEPPCNLPSIVDHVLAVLSKRSERGLSLPKPGLDFEKSK